MEEWSKDFFKALETAADEVEHFFTEVTKEFTEIVEAFTTFSEDAVDQLVDEIDQHFGELVEPVLEVFFGFEESINDTAQPFIHTIEPILDEHSACVGCRHYHGQVYGGNLLVCGMHPYGWEAENCPDWESTWAE